MYERALNCVFTIGNLERFMSKRFTLTGMSNVVERG